jgi:hypothetical protein
MATTPTEFSARSGNMRTDRIAMKLRSVRTVACLVAGVLLVRAAAADATASHRVTVRVEPVSALALQGGDIALAVPQTSDGAPASATDATCSLDWLTNLAGQKITVASSVADPRLPLAVEAFDVQGGEAVGAAELGGAARDLVIGLAPGIGSCGLRYVARAAGLTTPAPEVHVITYTLTDRR